MKMENTFTHRRCHNSSYVENLLHNIPWREFVYHMSNLISNMGWWVCFSTGNYLTVTSSKTCHGSIPLAWLAEGRWFESQMRTEKPPPSAYML